MAAIEKPDLCIIGAGALGIGIAIRARQLGASVMLIERGADEPGDPAGGQLASSALAASAARAQAMRTADVLGLNKHEPKPNFRAVVETSAASVAAAAPAWSTERLKALGIDCWAGSPSFVDPRTLKIGETAVRAGHFVLATGAAPAVPDIAGLSEIAYFTPDSIGEHPRKLTHLAVIGGDQQAVELAQAYRRLGSQVTLIAHGPLLAGFDPELVAIVLRQLHDEGLTILFDGMVAAIHPRKQGTGITVRTGETETALDVSHVLVSLGRVPALDGLALELARVQFDPASPQQLQLNAGGQTTNSRISAVGGAAGESLAHIASQQGARLAERVLAGTGSSQSAAAMPRLLQTGPALAQVGVVELGAPLAAGLQVVRANMAENAAARLRGEGHGMVKLVLDPVGKILGAGCVGPQAGELVAMLALAMARGLHAHDLAGLILPQPSLAATLTDLGTQFIAEHPLAARQRRPGWRRFLP